MATLNVQHSILAYGDTAQAGSPLRRFIDWTRRLIGISVENPLDNLYTLAPGETRTILNGTRATTIDGTTTFTLSKNPLLPSTYRFTFTAGADPGLRVDRALNLTGLSVTMIPNGDGTQTFSVSGAGTPLAAVQAGDILWIPGVSTGDSTSLFSPANEGAWIVLVGGNLSLVLGRAGAYSGRGEVQTITAAPQVSAFSSAGVQVGDKTDVTAGFATANQGTYTITQVTSKWFEVTSARGLAAQAGILPTAAGLQFFTGSKRWVRIEVNQEAAIRFNGDTSNFTRLSPVVAGDDENTGWLDKFGTVYSLSVVNRSSSPLKLLVQSAE